MLLIKRVVCDFRSLQSTVCLEFDRTEMREQKTNSPLFSATVFSFTSFKVRYFRSHLVRSFASSMFLLTCEIICLYLALALFNHVYLMFFLKRIYFAVIKHRNGSHYRANSLVLFLSLVFQSEKCLQSHFIELKEFSFGFSIAFISFSPEKCGAFFCVHSSLGSFFVWCIKNAALANQTQQALIKWLPRGKKF